MITVKRRSYIEGATPEEVFTALSDPKGIERLLPRMRKVELLSRRANCARLVTHMAIGGMFGTIRCEGDLHWIEPHEIVFKVAKPLPVETRWSLAQAPRGTELNATMSLDLKPLLGGMAKFVPNDAVADMIGKELDSALKEMTLRMREALVRTPAAA